MQIAIWARVVFVQNHPNRKIVCPEPKLKCTLTMAGRAISRGCTSEYVKKIDFSFRPNSHGEEIWQMKIRPKVEKRWHSPVPSTARAGKSHEKSVSTNATNVWIMKGKTNFLDPELGWVFPSLSSRLTNVVCDSSGGQICNGGAKVCHGSVTECHLLVIPRGHYAKCNAHTALSLPHYLVVNTVIP